MNTQKVNLPFYRQEYLPQTPEDIGAYTKAREAGDLEVMKKHGPRRTTWEDASRKKTVLEQAAREYDKAQTRMASTRKTLDEAALAYYQSIPITDSTLYSECPFSRKRIDLYMARNMYKLAEDLFRWLAPRTFQAVTELNTFLAEMLPAIEWGMKMKALEPQIEAKPKIGPEPEEIF